MGTCPRQLLNKAKLIKSKVTIEYRQLKQSQQQHPLWVDIHGSYEMCPECKDKQ